jgi:putative ABC transport system permease protein
MTKTPYTGLFVVAENLDDVGKVRTEIVAVGYSTSAPENLIASVLRYLHVVEIVLTAVGTIALVVAALGISNAMLAAVRERRREIGVLKAIGGRDRDVLRIFLVEAGVLGLIGGALGAVAGWFIAGVVGNIVNGYLVEQGLASVELVLPTTILVGTIAGSTLLAIVAGTLPAARAARLPAREAVDAI